MVNSLSGSPHTINVDFITAVPFKPDINIRLPGISSGHDVKDSALCGDHGQNSVVVGDQTGQSLTGAIICKKAHRLQLLHFLKLRFQLLKLQLHRRIRLRLQLFLDSGDLAFQRFPFLPVSPEFCFPAFIKRLLILIQILRHGLHHTGLSFPRCCNYHGIEIQRLTVAGSSLYHELSLQTGSQHTQ